MGDDDIAAGPAPVDATCTPPRRNRSAPIAVVLDVADVADEQAAVGRTNAIASMSGGRADLIGLSERDYAAALTRIAEQEALERAQQRAARTDRARAARQANAARAAQRAAADTERTAAAVRRQVEESARRLAQVRPNSPPPS